MNTAGEYTAPLIRVAPIHVPVVSGFATGRLRSQIDLFASGYVDNMTQFTFENTGTTTYNVLIKQVDDRKGDWAARSTLITVSGLVPGGRKIVNAIPSLKFLEIWGNDSGPDVNGQLKLQIASQIRFDYLALDRRDAFYPTKLWKPQALSPPDSTTPDQSFP